jgi:hypothetical protein
VSQMSDYLEDAIRNYFKGVAFPAAPVDELIAAYTATPSDSGGGTEVVNAVGYTRMPIAAGGWTSGGAGTGSISNTAAITFPAATGAGWGTVTHFGVFDDQPIAGGGSTTLAADPALGATNFKFTAVTNFNAGDWIRIGTAGQREYRRIVTVGTAGSGGTGVDIDTATTIDHANAETVVEVGNLLMWAALTASKLVNAADVLQFAPGALVLTFA